MKQCIACGTELSEKIKFCPSCGKKVEPQGCPQCGCTSIQAGIKFCPECGARIASPEDTVSTVSQPNNHEQTEEQVQIVVREAASLEDTVSTVPQSQKPVQTEKQAQTVVSEVTSIDESISTVPQQDNHVQTEQVQIVVRKVSKIMKKKHKKRRI